jgi:CTD small phosphatase-like protein 2
VPAPKPYVYNPPPSNGLDDDDFDPFLFIKSLPALSSLPLSLSRPSRFCLPKKSPSAPPITLALDLDETLVHCSVAPLEKFDLQFNVTFNGMNYAVYVKKRPYLFEFLARVADWFEVLVFTASQKVYADKLLNILDPHRKYIQHRVFRDSCLCIEGNYLKDLNVLGRDLAATAIIDNSIQAFAYQLNNGIPIESWFDDEKDRELLNLLPFLETLKDAHDVRPIIRDTFRLQEIVDNLKI